MLTSCVDGVIKERKVVAATHPHMNVEAYELCSVQTIMASFSASGLQSDEGLMMKQHICGWHRSWLDATRRCEGIIGLHGSFPR